MLPSTSKEQELNKKLREIQLQEIEEKTKSLAQSLKLPYLNLTLLPVDIDALFLVDEEEARRANIAVISKNGNNLKVSVLDPGNAETKNSIEALKQRGFLPELYLVSLTSLERAFADYNKKIKKEIAKTGIVKVGEMDLSTFEKEIQTLSDLKNKISKIPLTQLIEILLAGALKTQASDIHLEPEETDIRLRYRIDGVLADIAELDNQIYSQILSRVKIMSGLKINIHQAPQDGRFTIRQENIDIEIRVSILPGAYGENIVMRLLDPRTIKQDLKDLGMRKDFLEMIEIQLKKTTGAILTTGPTGSGKTTALYAFIRQVNEEGSKIITIEDPIEYHIKGISQTQVDKVHGYTFATGLRSIVRQDPDVILVGEIRDKETAEIAMHAALTGHLVFSTLHTNDAAGAIPRLIDLGVNPSVIAPAINIAIAQRLVRKLCPECKEKIEISEKQAERFNRILKSVPENLKPKNANQIYKAVGCEKCNGTGYKGRIGIFEVFAMDAELEKLILKNPGISEIKETLEKKGMIIMLQDGILKVLEGVTSLEEIERILGSE